MKNIILIITKVTEKQWLASILLIALLFRVTTVIALDIEQLSDFIAYDQMAYNLITGKGLSEANGNLAFMSGGYSFFFLAPLYGIFGHHIILAQVGNAFLGVGTTWLIYTITCEVGGGRCARILAPLFFALYLPSWIYAEYLAKENLMTPIILWYVLISIKLFKKPSNIGATLIGLSVGLLAIVGSAGLALVPVSLLALLKSNQPASKKITQFVLAGAVALTVVTPWLIRNSMAVGSPVLNTNGGFNLYLGNNPSATGMFVSITDTPRGTTWHQLRATGELKASNTLKAEAMEWIKRNPSDFLLLSIKKAGLFWMPPIHEGRGPSSKLEDASRQIWLLQYIFLCVASVAGLTVRRLRNTPTLLLWGSLLSYTSIHMIFYVIFRYREPVMPFIIILAALSVEHLFRSSPFIIESKD